MKHVCSNCYNFEEGICIAHSLNSCEHVVNHPDRFGTDCKDFDPIDESDNTDETTDNKDDFEW